MTPVKLGLRSLFTGVLVLLLGLWAPSPVAADFKAGADAALREEFDTALREWLPLAKAGDERAQYNIGLMYEHGRGVPRDLQKAFKWYQRAAERGAVPAQHNLGAMYASGEAVKRDLVQAYKWFHIAAVTGFELAVDAVNKAPQLLPPEELGEARSLAIQWIDNFTPEIGT